MNSGATTAALGSSAITLTNTSTQYQVAQINSLANSIVNLPSATTLTVKGSYPFVIENRSPIGANLSVKDNAGNVVGYIPVGYIGTISLKDNSTAAGTWAIDIAYPQTFFNWDTTSITSNTVTPAGSDNYQMVGLSSTSFVRMWTVTTGFNSGNVIVTYYQQAATISGSTITFGSITSFVAIQINTPGTNAAYANIKTLRLSNTAYVIMVGYTGYNDNCGRAYTAGTNVRTCTVSGTTITVGTSSAASMPVVSTGDVPNSGDAAYYNGCTVRLSDTSYAVVFNKGLSNTYAPPKGYDNSLSCTVITVSGTTQTVGTSVNLGTSTYTAVNSLTAMSSTLILVAYGQATTAGTTIGRNKLVTISVSGTVPTWNTPINIESADITSGIFSTGFFRNNCGVAPSATQAIFQVGNGIAEGTVSGTVPTYDSTPNTGYIGTGMYLVSSSKVFAALLQGYGATALGTNRYTNYLTAVTGGYFITQNGVNIYPTSLSPLYGNPQPYFPTPLGAQPTTAFVGITDALPYGQYTLLGNSL
jgi:hypothetical protein